MTGAVRTGREKAAGRYTVGFSLRLPAQSPVPSRPVKACNSMVNERLTEADGQRPPAAQEPVPKSSRHPKGQFCGIIRLSAQGLLRGAFVL